jgi:hypothetical protein
MRFRNLLRLPGTAAALVLSLAPYAASAQDEPAPEHPIMSDRWFIGAGAMWSESNVTASLNRRVLGAIIDFEHDVGLSENNAIGLAMMRWRFSRRWQLEAEYFNLDRDNEKEISRTVDWGDLSLPENARVRGKFDVEDFRLSIGYSFFRTKDKEVGVGVGAHWVRFEAGLFTQNFGSEQAAQSAPLPFATLYARMALSDRWLLSLRVDRLSLDTGTIDGKVFSSGAEFIYQPWRHFNVGLGFRDLNFQISSTSEDWRGKAQVQQSGPVVFIATTF